MIELKEKKIDDNTSVIHDALTNDPIAISTKQSGSKNLHNITWHPVFRKLYPETGDLVNMNLGNNIKSDQVKNRVASKYGNIISGKPNRDPLKTVYAGRSQRQVGDRTAEFDEFHVHDPEGKHVATISVAKLLTPSIGVDPDVFRHYDSAYQDQRTQLTFIGEHPTQEKFELSRKKHPGSDPIALVHQVKHWLDNREKEPTFVGSHFSPNLKIYKTKLKPEDASQKYMEHLQKHSGYQQHQFSRVGPTVFYAMKPTGPGGEGKHEVIDTSQPGIVHHMHIQTFAKDHYNSKPLNEVIE